MSVDVVLFNLSSVPLEKNEGLIYNMYITSPYDIANTKFKSLRFKVIIPSTKFTTYPL